MFTFMARFALVYLDQSYVHAFSFSASGELFRNVCWLLFLITNLTDPDTQKFPLEYLIFRETKGDLSIAIVMLFDFRFSNIILFRPFSANVVPFELFSDAFRYILVHFSSINNTFIENRRDTRHFK